jgi:hypothetical protein
VLLVKFTRGAVADARLGSSTGGGSVGTIRDEICPTLLCSVTCNATIGCSSCWASMFPPLGGTRRSRRPLQLNHNLARS